MIKWFRNIFCCSEKYYYRGRSDGYFACENLIISRIKKLYPEMEDQLIMDLLQ